MSELVNRNGKMYKQVPCYDEHGELDHFVMVPVPAGPAVPPESVFAASPADVAPCAPEVSQDAEESIESEETTKEEEIVSEEVACEIAPPEDEPSPALAEELIVDDMAVQKTIEDTDVLGEDFSEDAESSTGSVSINEESDTESVKEARKEDYYLAFSSLDKFDFDKDLQTKDGKYLTNVDGRYVFDLSDISCLINDGLVHRLHFQDSPNKVQRVKRAKVCHKPVYKTLKKIQVRNGPGSKFEKCGIIPAGVEVLVIQEGLMECDLGLVRTWMEGHLPRDLVYNFGRSDAATFEDFIDSAFLNDDDEPPINVFLNETYDEDESATFMKAFAAAKRKVKVMYQENGIDKFGWISKRKNSGPLIRRIYGKSTPQILVTGFETMPVDTDYVHQDDVEGTIVADTMHFIENNRKNTVIKYTDAKGNKKETIENHRCYPPMSFYKNIVKQEIRDIIGSQKRPFTVTWEGNFRSDRFRGLEKKSVSKNGKTRMRTGYYEPSTQFVITFQKLSDAVTFYNADLSERRLAHADMEWERSYSNLQPVPVKQCPEYRQFKRQVKHTKNTRQLQADLGISYITV